MKETAIVEFFNGASGSKTELEIPLFITANELIQALNKAYDLKMNTDDIFSCYLVAENPIALLRGNKQLKEYGIRNGSAIIYWRE